MVQLLNEIKKILFSTYTKIKKWTITSLFFFHTVIILFPNLNFCLYLKSILLFVLEKVKVQVAVEGSNTLKDSSITGSDSWFGQIQG